MALTTTAYSNITSWQSSHIPLTSSVSKNMTSFWTNFTESYTTDTHTTDIPSTGDIPEYWGFIAASIAVLFFGSVPLPVKKYKTGDGNICVVPIVKTVGLGLGFGIWSMVCLLSGWSTGSAFVFVLVKTEVSPVEDDEKESLLTKELQKNASSISFDTAGEENSYVDRLFPGMQRIVGLILCIFSGLMYGQMFTGATYVQDHPEHYPGSTLNGLDYVFADFCGIYVTSTVFFVTYIIVMKFKPKVYPKVMIPALISGVMWAIGNSCWFVANRALSIPVAFPIVTTGPSIVASLWGVLVFKEIKLRLDLYCAIDTVLIVLINQQLRLDLYCAIDTVLIVLINQKLRLDLYCAVDTVLIVVINQQLRLDLYCAIDTVLIVLINQQLRLDLYCAVDTVLIVLVNQQLRLDLYCAVDTVLIVLINQQLRLDLYCAIDTVLIVLINQQLSVQNDVYKCKHPLAEYEQFKDHHSDLR
ncbi:unnamed protein product [Mytilus coruscus]|uniref:Transmembrane protein 144 n=1 Tax=Mytilus coruscus TaxID=42192 RepID=A0A6J8CCG2_MYTCO|nr:unnamed protein product [Mytilus coruscus]